MLIIRLCTVLMMVVFVSCGGGGGGGGGNDTVNIGPNAQCTPDGKNEFVYELLNDSYLWYDEVTQGVDPSIYPTPQALLDSVTPAQDRWSYVVPSEDFYQYYDEGQYPGMGFAVGFDSSRNLWVRFVYQGSPADAAGIRRTDRILRINGRSASSLPDIDAVFDEVYRYDTASVEVVEPAGQPRIVTLQWDWVTISTVLHREVFPVEGVGLVGYLVFESFIDPAWDDLDTAFADFRQQGISDLIIDLRYNGGGRLSIAGHMASLIAGDNANGEVFKRIIHNDKYSQNDVALPFTMPSNALGLDRVFVISTGNTCSASESVIMGLRPFIQVIQIGATTCGKPVGMYAHEFCDLVVLPIEFKAANANDESDYFGGLAPTCEAMDDLARQFGDQEEDSLRTAVYYIANNSCPVQARSMNAIREEIPNSVNELKGFRREIGAF